jgi:hypothetical protein
MIAGLQTGAAAEPPRPFRLSSRQVLEIREGGGGLALFGLPFFVAGCFLDFHVLRAVFAGAALRGGMSLVGFAGMGLAFTGVGAVLTCGRRWLTVDLSRGKLVRSYGLLVPLHTQARLISEFNAVVMAYNPGDSESPETFPVRLRGLSGPDFKVRAPGRFGESRALAEYLSDFLQLPLVDMITDHETVAGPGHSYQGLRERVVAAATQAIQPERPARMRSGVTESGGTTIIVIPGGGGLAGHVLGIVLPLAVLLFVMPRALHFLTRPETSPVNHFAMVLLLTLVFVPPLIFVSMQLMVAGSRKRTTVITSPTGLQIEQGSGWRKHNKLIPAADLLDVDSSTIHGAIQNIQAAANVPADTISDSARWIQVLKKWVPSRGIVIKSRTELITFGEGLPAAELQYLAYRLRKGLAGHSTAIHS